MVSQYCKSGNFRAQLFSRFADFELFRLFVKIAIFNFPTEHIRALLFSRSQVGAWKAQK